MASPVNFNAREVFKKVQKVGPENLIYICFTYVIFVIWFNGLFTNLRIKNTTNQMYCNS